MNWKTIVFAVAIAFSLGLAACSSPLPSKAESPLVEARQLVDEQTLYSSIPHSDTELWSLRVIRYNDGSARAFRSTIPYNAASPLTDGYMVGGSNLQQEESGLAADFDQGAFFIPFDPGEATRNMGPGTMHVKCLCSMAGFCDFSAIILNTGIIDYTCKARNCSGDCGMWVTFADRPTDSHDKGIYIQASSIETF